MYRILSLIMLLLIAHAGPAAAANGERVALHRDWGAYVGKWTSGKVCFALSEPKSSKPRDVSRGPIYFYVTRWPGDKASGEISIKFGYPLRPSVAPEITIGKNKFKLFSKDEAAFIESIETEKRLIKAMEGGASMIVHGRSQRGTLTTDRYSLKGVTAVLKRIAKDCP